MAKNTHQAEEGVGKQGEPTPQREGKRPEEKEEIKEEGKEKYVIQVSPQIEGEEGWLSVKKEGKIFVFSSQKNAEESLSRVMQRHPEMLRGRVMRIQKSGDSSVLIPVMEVNGKQIIQQSKDILPPEMKEYVDETMLSMMNEEEISGIRSLISDLIRKKQEIERFSRIAVQRSSFLRNKEKKEKMEKLKNRYEKAKERLEKAKAEWDAVREAIEDFTSEIGREYPEQPGAFQPVGTKHKPGQDKSD